MLERSEAKARIFLSPPHMSGRELELVRDAFATNYIAPVGPMVDAFEHGFAKYTNIKHSVALSSGTAAMHLALRYLGVGPDDEVIASSLTFIGSVTPVTFLGATPVFIDCDRETWNMDPVLLERELERCDEKGQLPKAVIPTDLYGQCCDYGRIYQICGRFGIPVVVDAAEAMGAKFKKSLKYRVRCAEKSGVNNECGLLSDELMHAGIGARAAVFSFNGNKIMTTSGGGMLASDDEALIEKARFWSQQAREPLAHYEHEEIGYNYRMSNIIAAIGCGQLRSLEARVQRKREIFNYYQTALADVPGIEFMPEANYNRCNRWLTVVLFTPEIFGVEREAVRLALEAENIESRPVWKPMHLQPVFFRAECSVPGVEDSVRSVENKDGTTNSGKKKYPCRVVGGAVAADLFERGLCLPSGTAMSEGELERVVGVIRRMHKG